MSRQTINAIETGKYDPGLETALKIARAMLSRETVKKEVAQQAQAVWEKRLAFTDLKRKFLVLNDKLDKELLVDKERPAKKLDFT